MSRGPNPWRNRSGRPVSRTSSGFRRSTTARSGAGNASFSWMSSASCSGSTAWRPWYIAGGALFPKGDRIFWRRLPGERWSFTDLTWTILKGRRLCWKCRARAFPLPTKRN
ncbi:hypothetical exported protein [Syntrophus aciditrophicus SB]|uniref:Hypothetical exported protein n=1 Tax=Syntrophus aciditrophicus (strain SB) TaxID=56780 RepID=Q2LWR9_SYNAS|nr:hypothetical exported protein [Syntrophus aciditrophicus SB]